MDIRRYFQKVDGKQPAAAKKKKPVAATNAGAAITATTTPKTVTPKPKETMESKNKKRKSRDTFHQKKVQGPSKAMMHKRRKWVKDGACFVCHEVFEKDQLEPCQCFQQHGIKGFGLMFCQDCDDDDVYNCSGPCGERLCFRSCESSTCCECGQVYCQGCLDSDDVLFSCGTCDKKYCEGCTEERGDTPAMAECDFCHKDSCKACDKTIEMCEFCGKTVCDKCVDKRSDPIDGR